MCLFASGGGIINSGLSMYDLLIFLDDVFVVLLCIQRLLVVV